MLLYFDNPVSHTFSLDSATTTVRHLKALIAEAIGLSPARQRLVGNTKTFNEDDESLTNLPHLLTLRDLGPQVSWRGVFFLEYAGPFLIHMAWVWWSWPSLASFQM